MTVNETAVSHFLSIAAAGCRHPEDASSGEIRAAAPMAAIRQHVPTLDSEAAEGAAEFCRIVAADLGLALKLVRTF